jgi:hypothetical protein
MTHPVSPLRSAVVLALAAAGASVAHADDSSLNPFTGESYAAFNGANRPAMVNPQFDPRPSAWRQQNPDGLSERVLQSYSAAGENWQVSTPTYADAPAVASFRASHPGGLSEQELQALSSDGDAWQVRANAPSAAAGPKQTSAQGTEPMRERLARLLHPAQ